MSDKFNEHLIELPDADLVYYSNWLNEDIANKLFSHFHHHLAWQEATIKIFGKQQKIPRLQAWYGNKEASYTYSGLNMQPLPWSKNLSILKERCEQECGARFNSVLANLYRDGSDSMGFHSDNEPELGYQPCIASVSLGEQRNFDFKHKHKKLKHRICLEHGSLLVMKGDTQKYWQHGINKSKKPHGPRINFTFRFIEQMA